MLNIALLGRQPKYCEITFSFELAVFSIFFLLLFGLLFILEILLLFFFYCVCEFVRDTKGCKHNH